MVDIFVAVTDWDWYDFLRTQPDIGEVNFWQPGGRTSFGALEPGELFLFKLHSPRNFIVGGGVFWYATLSRFRWRGRRSDRPTVRYRWIKCDREWPTTDARQ